MMEHPRLSLDGSLTKGEADRSLGNTLGVLQDDEQGGMGQQLLFELQAFLQVDLEIALRSLQMTCVLKMMAL